MKPQIILSLILVFLLSFLNCTNAQVVNPAKVVKLKTGAVTPVNNVHAWMDSFNSQKTTVPVLVLLHFSKLPNEREKAQLMDLGIVLQNYIPDNTYTAIITQQANTTALAGTGVTGIMPYDATWKISPNVIAELTTHKNGVEALINTNNYVNKAEIKAFLKLHSVQLLPSPNEHFGFYKAIIEMTQLPDIAAWYGILSIDVAREMQPLDQQSRPVVKSNSATWPTTAGGYGLAGDSVVVGVGDNASSIYHADTRDRVRNFNPYKMANHGAHVSGIVGATGLVDPLGEGMAPRVNIINYLYDQVLAATSAMYADYNMTVTNNSYAVLLGDCDYAGTYDGYARYLDSLSLAFPNVLHVFASGNDGYLTCTPYPKGFATVAGGYSPAKNNLLVGSIMNNYIDAHDESRGPTKDGRLKPEIVAVGLDVYSTIGVDEYKWAAGTSMASPHVAGGIALLTQQFKRIYRSQPTAQVLKAITLAGATDRGNIGPDFTFGFGSLNVGRSLKIIDNQHFYTNSVNNGSTHTQTINVPAGTAQLKVLITWHDQPASLLAATQLVNDLDISVTDPTGNTHLPLVLDSREANVNNVAVEKPDHLNNTEEVIINNPVVGTYTISVKGYQVPYPAQSFTVAYDILPTTMELTYPTGGEGILSSALTEKYDSLRVFWDAVNNGNTYKVELSTNNGSTWRVIKDSIAPSQHYISFVPDSINSGNCLVRLSRLASGETITSGKFAMNVQPILVADSSQCPGYLNVHWNKVPNAAYYQLFIKKGPYLQLAGITADSNYTFSGLPLHTKTYVAVQPVLNGIAGYRSTALIKTADSGDCSSPISIGDLALEAVVSPLGGRKYTSSTLSSAATIRLKARNLYKTTTSSYRVWYSINGSSWVAVNATTPIPANDTQIINITGIDLADTITYNMIFSIENQSFTDPVKSNDTIRYTIKHLNNAPLNLPFIDDFEQMNALSVLRDSLGIAPNHHWDFYTQSASGRLRTFVNNDITISGTRSVSMDADRALVAGTQNALQGTFNLSGYDTATSEIRLDFDYVIHGTPKTTTGNLLRARAADNYTWLPLYAYDFTTITGTLLKAKSLSLTDICRQARQNFSSSFQLQFGQSDTSLIAARNFGNGMTIDNVKLYTVTNDAAIASIQNPLVYNCGITGSQPLIVEVKNGVNKTLYNIQLFYRFDSGTVYSGLLDSIAPKSSMNYTFPQLLNIPIGAAHFIDAWLVAAGDTYPNNDSLLHFTFRNNQVVRAYPYLENFENGNGGYYAGGVNSSWQLGTPASPKIKKAASGVNAWKTNLTGRHNNLEQSYVYSPCFDVSGITNPMLSFSTATDIEDCGNVLCDKAFVEYSYNGTYWRRLGSANSGTNWYDSTFQSWTRNGVTRWHVASIPLPTSIGSSVISLRFGLQSDPGASFEGFAIDDIHIFSRDSGIHTPIEFTTAALDISGAALFDYKVNNELIAAISPNNQVFNNATITVNKQDSLFNIGKSQQMLPRSYTLQLPTAPLDSIGVKLFITDREILATIADTSCPTCAPIIDVYSTGITQYHNVNSPVTENSSLIDDTGGNFNYLPYQQVKWVPYDNGYYAYLKTLHQGEFWFNSGGPVANLPFNEDAVRFIAYQQGMDAVLLWQSAIDTAIDTYYVDRSVDLINFNTVKDTSAVSLANALYTLKENTGIFSATTIYYRLTYRLKKDTTLRYCPIRHINLMDETYEGIVFNAALENERTVKVSWSSFIDQLTKRYVLERAINNSEFSAISNTAALGIYGRNYSELDQPMAIHEGDRVHYRLKAVLQTNDTIVLPIKTLIWEKSNVVTQVFPNPVTDGTFQIQWYSPAGTIMNVSLYDITGKRLLETSAKSTQYKNTTTVKTAFKPHGLYLLHTEINGNQQAWKVVFQ